jgi:hypothetical protein
MNVLINNPFLVKEVPGSFLVKVTLSRFQWPRGLRRRSAAPRLLRLLVRIPPGYGCLSVVSVVCCHLEVSGRANHSSRGVLLTVVRH